MLLLTDIGSVHPASSKAVIYSNGNYQGCTANEHIRMGGDA